MAVFEFKMPLKQQKLVVRWGLFGKKQNLFRAIGVSFLLYRSMILENKPRSSTIQGTKTYGISRGNILMVWIQARLWKCISSLFKKTKLKLALSIAYSWFKKLFYFNSNGENKWITSKLNFLHKPTYIGQRRILQKTRLWLNIYRLSKILVGIKVLTSIKTQ